MLEVDHVVLTAPDIDAAADRLLTEYGLASVAGGRHEGLGTGNRIVPLGTSYVEIMGVVDDEEAADSPLAAWVRRRSAKGPRLAALCLRTDFLDILARRLDLDVTPMARTTPTGTRLQWRLVGLDEALADPQLPFFIEWDMDEADHPARAEVEHRVAPQGISWVAIGGDHGRIAAWIGAWLPELRISPGEPGIEAIGIATADGELVLQP